MQTKLQTQQNNEYKETELGLLPKEWEIVKLGEIFSEKDKKTRRIKILPDNKYKIILTRLYAKGIQLKEIKSGEKISAKHMYLLRVGDFIFSKINLRRGAFDFVPIELNEAVVSTEHPILELNRNRAHQAYVKFYLSQPYCWELFKKESKGFGGKERIKVREFVTVKIPLPPLPTQQKIASILSVIDEKIQAEENKKKALEGLFKSMLHNLMTAKIRVKGLGVENE